MYVSWHYLKSNLELYNVVKCILEILEGKKKERNITQSWYVHIDKMKNDIRW